MNPPAPTADPKPVNRDGTYPGPDAAELAKKARRKLTAAGKYLEKRFHRRAMRLIEIAELNHYMDPETGEETEADEDRVKVPYPYANVRQLVAELAIRDPEPMVTPLRRSFDVPAEADPETGMPLAPASTVDGNAAARQMKGALRYVVRRSNFKRAAKAALVEGVPSGLGCVMLSAVPGSKVPTYLKVPWRDLLWDTDCGHDIYRAKWVARRVVLPLEEIRANPEFTEDRHRVPAATLDKRVYGETAEQYGVLWDFFDLKEDRRLMIVDGMDLDLYGGKRTVTQDFDFRVEDGDLACDGPFAFYVNEESAKNAWGIGDVAPIESQTEERDKIRTKQVQHIDRFDRRYLVRKDFLDEGAEFQLTEGGDGALVYVKDDITPANFQAVQDAPLSSDVYRVDETIQRDLDVIQPIGANGVARGVGGAPGTLGEAEIIDSNADTRMGDKKDAVQAFYGRLFRLTAQFIQQHWVESDELLVAGDGTGESDWLAYDPALRRGEFAFDVDPESGKDNSALYRRQAQEAMTVLAPMLLPSPAPAAMPGMPPAGPGPCQLQMSPGLALMARRFLENYESFEKDVDQIVPEEWTQPQAPAPAPGEGGDPEADAALLEEIDGSDPEAFLDKLNALPENEAQLIRERIAALTGGSSPAPQPVTPA